MRERHLALVLASVLGLATFALPGAAAAVLSVQIEPSRCASAGEQCPAPVAVMFRSNISNEDFLEWHCEWDFGDDDAVSGANAQWTYGSAIGEYRKKNRAAGPIAQHVYEGARSAVYNVQLSCEDPGGDTGSDTAQIHIDDPNDPSGPWSGSSTICVSASGNFAGCPSAAQHITSNDFDATMGTHAAPGRRILYRRGDSFSHGGVIRKINLAGPTLIGAFGTGAKPRISGSAGATSQGFLAFGGLENWAFADLEFTATGGSGLFCTQGQCLSPLTPNDHVLWLRIDTNGFSFSLLGTHNGIQPANERHKNMFWVGPSRVNGTSQFNSFFSDAWGGGMIDTYIIGGYHNYRFMCVRNFVMQNNRTENGTSSATLRGCPAMSGANAWRIVVSDNDFKDPQAVGYPNGTGLNMQVHYMIYERNFHDNVSNQSHSFNSVFRNNTCIRNGDTCLYLGVWEGSMPPAYNVRFYNNSFFNSNGNQPGIRFLGTVGSGNSCVNNMIYTPSGGSAPACLDAANGTPVIQNNLDDFGSSPYVGGNPNNKSGFALNGSSGSAAVDQGVFVSYYGTDALGVARPLDGDGNGNAQIDIGATEAGGAAGPPPPPPPAGLSPPVLLD